MQIKFILIVMMCFGLVSGCAKLPEISLPGFADAINELIGGETTDQLVEPAAPVQESLGNTEVEIKDQELAADMAPPVTLLIQNGCIMHSVEVDEAGKQYWRLRCPKSGWVNLEL